MRPLCRFRRSPCDMSGQRDSADNKAHSLVSAGAGAGAGQGGGPVALYLYMLCYLKSTQGFSFILLLFL